jgi:HlyD family secretion protein
MPILILAAAAAAGVWYWRMQSAEASTHLLVSGNIELTEVDIAFKTAGRLVELAVDEGAAVKKGTLIARLDPKQPAEARARDEAAVAAAESQLRQLETAIAYQRATLEGEVALRAAEARAARANLEDLLAGSRAQEIEQAEAAAADLRLQHEWAKREWERAQRLYKDEDISFAGSRRRGSNWRRPSSGWRWCGRVRGRRRSRRRGRSWRGRKRRSGWRRRAGSS